MNLNKEKTRTIGLIQMVCSSKPEQNLQLAMASIREAAAKGAQIICLPELFLSQYFCQSENPQHFSLAEPIPGPTSQQMAELAKELEIVLIVPLFEKRTEGIYHNSAVVIDADGSIMGSYRKMHIPDDPCFYEKYYFTPGDMGFQSFSTRFGKVGVLICWDQWFPEAARLTALKGAEIIFYPTAIGWHPKEKRKFGKSQLESWLSIQRSHAIANGIYVAAVNRVGIEKQGNKKIEFWGNSVIFDPSGNVVKKASLKENILICEIDFKKVETSRQHWPFFRDRRIDYYKGLLKNPRDA